MAECFHRKKCIIVWLTHDDIKLLIIELLPTIIINLWRDSFFLNMNYKAHNVYYYIMFL